MKKYFFSLAAVAATSLVVYTVVTCVANVDSEMELNRELQRNANK